MPLWKDKLKLGVRPAASGAHQGSAAPIQWGASILVNKIPAHASEFHATKASGTEVQHVFEINPAEYSGQVYALYQGQVYRIYRHFPKSESKWEIYMTDKGA